MRLEVLLREERVVDLGALDPAEAEERQRLRRDAEDVLEQDDAGRLVRHAGVDLRGGARPSRPSWPRARHGGRRKVTIFDSARRRAPAARAPRAGRETGAARSVAVDASPATTGACNGARRAQTRRELQLSDKNTMICEFQALFAHDLFPRSLHDLDGLLEVSRRGHFGRL